MAVDPIEDLVGDHRAVLGLLRQVERGEASAESEGVDKVVRMLSVHAAAEEMVVYPAAQDLVPGGRNLASQHRNEHQLVKDLLVGIERSAGPDRVLLVSALTTFLRHHVRHEEDLLFPKLRQHADEQQMADIGNALASVKKAAPTHPHPHAPDQPPAIFPAGLAASLADRVRDAVAGLRA